MNKYKMTSLKYAILFILAVICSQACQPTDDGHGHDHAQEGEASDHEGEVHLTTIQAKNIGVAFGKIENRNMVSSFKLSGRVELPPNGKSLASSHLSGNVTDIYIQPGQKVKKGQRIARIVNLEIIEWQQNYQSCLARIGYLKKEINRQEELIKSQVTIQKNLDFAQSELSQEQSKKDALEKKLSILGINVSSENHEINSSFYVLAPIAGLVEKILVSNGSHIEAKTPIVQIIDPSKLFIHFSAYEKDIKHLVKDQKVEFYPPGNESSTGVAEIEWISAIVDQHNNTYGVHASITTPKDYLSIGQYVEGAVIDTTLFVPSIPLSAIIEDKGLQFIFIFEDREGEEIHFKKLRMKSGIQHLGNVELIPIDEIPEGSQVVVEGAYFLMAESKLGEMEAGHSH